MPAICQAKLECNQDSNGLMHVSAIGCNEAGVAVASGEETKALLAAEALGQVDTRSFCNLGLRHVGDDVVQLVDWAAWGCRYVEGSSAVRDGVQQLMDMLHLSAAR